MTHPAVDPDAVERLRLGGGAAAPADAPTDASATHPQSAGPPTTAARLKAKARQVATPVVARVRSELDRAAGGEVEVLRSEVAELRAEVSRLRSEHAAAIAALQEDSR